MVLRQTLGFMNFVILYWPEELLYLSLFKVGHFTPCLHGTPLRDETRVTLLFIKLS